MNIHTGLEKEPLMTRDDEIVFRRSADRLWIALLLSLAGHFSQKSQ